MQGALLFIVVLSVLIIFHEWGHYITAKRLGIRVERFSIGFGPVLFRIRPKETEFCVSLVPLGGYVKMAGESPEDSTGEPWEFQTHSNFHKFLVVFAGPFLNLILALALFTAVFMIDKPEVMIPGTASKVGEVVAGFPAEKAGIQSGDHITEVNGKPIKLWSELLTELSQNTKGELQLKINREGEVITLDIKPQMRVIQTPEGEKPISQIGVFQAAQVITADPNSFCISQPSVKQ